MERKERKKERCILHKGLLGRRQAEGSCITLKGVYFGVMTNGLHIIPVMTWLKDYRMTREDTFAYKV